METKTRGPSTATASMLGERDGWEGVGIDMVRAQDGRTRMQEVESSI